MKTLLGFFFFVSFIFPAHGQVKEGFTLVGDMIVPSHWIIPENNRGFKMKTTRLWPKGELPIVFDNSISSSSQTQFYKWCQELGEFADVSCRPAYTSDTDYLVVQRTKKNICGSSYLGFYGGAQPLKIRCWRKRTAQHELMHALGLPHEHNRPDRDNFISMQWQNIRTSSKKSYKKVAIASVGFQAGFYDFDSLMHYESRSGSKNGSHAFYRKDKAGNQGLSLSYEMSYGDHYSLYKLYGGVEP